ncbi:hypothetical protein FN846DRAFT_987226 [Sphaerosporella brunnea]|uniref:Uncharacterized protein n=1 Tax=Sphaerosporella brunnea TaxID=1250544 RepID=A0A5J5ES68_9PEZI|nr:hypothetical protein FN846DRAFT_987226 [Sphaerosporella brunnea]
MWSLVFRGEHNQLGNSNYKELSEAVGLGSAEVHAALEHYFLDHEEWLCDRANHAKWNPVRVERLIATKTVTTDEWLKTAVELGERLGVETADTGIPALHSLHLLVKKKMDEKLRAKGKRVITATKTLAADKELVAATTLMGNSTYEYLAEELGFSSAELEKLDRLGDGTAGIEVQALHSLHLLLEKKVYEKLRAQAKRVITATKKLAVDKKLESADKEFVAANTLVDAADQIMAAAEIRTEGATLEAASGQTRSDVSDQETQLIKHRTEDALREEEAVNLHYDAAKGEEQVMKKVGALKLVAAENEAAAAEFKSAREKLLYEQAATGSSGPGYGSRDGRRLVRGLLAPGRSTNQARGASGSSTEVADEQDAVQPQRRRRDFVPSG